MKLINTQQQYAIITLPTPQFPYHFGIYKLKIEEIKYNIKQRNTTRKNYIPLIVKFNTEKYTQTIFAKQTDTERDINEQDKTVFLSDNTIITLYDKQIIKKILYDKMYKNYHKYTNNQQLIYAYRRLIQELIKMK